MATELGLGNEDTIQSLPSDHERTDLRQTWWSVVILDIISSWSRLLLFRYDEPITDRYNYSYR